MHIAMTSRLVPFFAPVALLRVLDPGLFVSLAFITAGQGGAAAAKNCGTENKHD